MTSKEFTLWLKGFMTACNEYSPTPKQWDIIKEELDKVSDNIGTPIGTGGWGTPSTTPLNWPIHTDPYNPYKVYCDSSSGSFSTTTATSLPFGSNVTYTNGGNDIKD